MAGSTVDIGTGTTVVFGTSGFTGQLMDASWDSITRESIDTSHHGLAAPGANTFGNMTFIPGDLSDPGELTLEIHTNTGQTGVTAQPPIDQPPETITVTFPKTTADVSAATWAGTGFVTDVGTVFPLEEKVVYSLTVKMSAGVTVVPAA